MAILALLGGSLYFALSQRSPKIEVGPYQALGAVAAEETLKLIGDKGQIVVVSQDPSAYEMPALAAQLQAFQTTAQKKIQVTVAIEKIVMDAMMMMSTGGRLPAGHFQKALQTYPKAGAIVLFLGFPEMAGRDLEALSTRTQKLVVVAGYRADYAQLLASRLIDLAIVPRFDTLPETAKKPQSLREWFDQEYVIITPDKAAALPR